MVFEGFVVDYDEPPEGLGKDEYSMVLDGSIKDEAGNTLYEGYFYLVASRELEGRLDLGIGSGISGEGELIVGGEEPIVRYVGEARA